MKTHGRNPVASSLAAALALRMTAINCAAGARIVSRIALAAVPLLLWGPPADAQVASAVVCSMAASGVNFGEVTGQSLAATGDIVLRCTGSGTVLYTIGLTTGLSGIYGL